MSKPIIAACLIALAAAPFAADKRIRKTSAATVLTNAPYEEFEETQPFELAVYMRDSWFESNSTSNPAAQKVRTCLETALRAIPPSGDPIQATATALRSDYPGSAERVYLRDKYLMLWNELTQAMELICTKHALFAVHAETGTVEVSVTQRM